MRARRWAAAGVAGAMVTVMAPGGVAQAHQDKGKHHKPPTTTITLLNFNDFHGRIDPVNDLTTKWATTIEAQRAAAGEKNTLLLGNGDLIGASLFNSSVAQDQPTIDVMNAMCLAASSVGNHEFDKGFEDLTKRVIGGPAGAKPGACPTFEGTQRPGTNARWSYLGANVYKKGTKVPALPEYATFTISDGAGGKVTVGIVGAVTAETPALVSPGGIEQIDIGDPVAAVNRVAGQLTDGKTKNGEADILVVEYHEGAPNGSQSLAENVAASPAFASIVKDTSPKFSVIFNGHTHQTYAYQLSADGRTGGFRPLLQAGNYADHIGKVVLTYNAKACPKVTIASSENLLPAAAADLSYPRVAQVDTLVRAAKAYADEVGLQPVASQTASITTAYTGGTFTGPDNTYVVPGGPTSKTGRDDRASESTMGGIVANSLRDSLAPAELGGAQIGVVNPGGLRDELFYPQIGTEGDGVITYAEANNVLPFVNNLWTTTLTGAQLKTMLEQQWQRDASGNVPSRPYLQLGLSDNVTYTFDPSLPEGSRITSIMIDGVPYDPAAGYRVGTFSFLISGGDNFRVFTEGTNPRDSGLVDRDAWIAYLSGNSPVSPDFARQSATVTGMPTSVAPGESLAFGLAGLDLTSLGSPANSSVEVSIAGVSAGTVPVTSGAATVSLTVPTSVAGGQQLVVATASPSGTTVSFPVTVSAASQPESPVTEPPVTEPPVTEPPVTEPPVTEPPVTEPPVTKPPARSKVTVLVRAVKSASALQVDVDPNRGKGYWTFQVQRQATDGKWKRVADYRTEGSDEVRTLDLPKGAYRVVVPTQYGYEGATSQKVTLHR